MSSNENDDETGIEIVQLSVNDETASEEEADGVRTTKEPTDEVAEAPSHEVAPKEKTHKKTTTSQGDATTGRQNPANVPSTSKGKTRSSHTSDLERRSFQIALETNNTRDESDDESDSNRPAKVLHRNIDDLFRTPEVLATLLRNSIESRQEIFLQNGERIIVGEDWCRDVIIPNTLKITQRKKQESEEEEKRKGNGKGKRTNTKETATAQEIEVTKDTSHELVQEIDDFVQKMDEPERQ